MEAWIYLLVIFGLVCLAGGLLYARMASDKKGSGSALHHSPGNWDLKEELADELDMEEDVNEVTLRLGIKKEVAREAEASKSEYLDELQEAAAGLARLMRSSPVPKADPLEDVLDSTGNEETIDTVVEIQHEECAEDSEAARAQASTDEKVACVVEIGILETETEILAEQEELEEKEIVPTLVTEAEVILPVEMEVATILKEEVVLPLVEEEISEIGQQSSEPIVEISVAANLVAEMGDCFEKTAEESAGTEEQSESITVRGLLGEELLARLNELDESLNEFEELLGGIESGFRLLSETDAKIPDQNKQITEKEEIIAVA